MNAMLVFETEDLRLHYKVIGEGIPLLMLHGRPTDHHAMTGAFEPIFAQRTDWKRIYVDLPGMGATGGAECIQSNDDVVDALLLFMDACFPKQSFAVAGFSYGGYIARGVLHHRHAQMTGMLLLVPAMSPPDERVTPPPRYFGNDSHLFNDYPQPFADTFAKLTAVHDADAITRMGEILTGLQHADHVFLQRISANYPFSFDIDEECDFDRPMLILTGKHDPVTGYETANEWHKQYPRATFVALDRAGHGLHMAQPKLFNALVEEWLDRVEEDLMLQT